MFSDSGVSNVEIPTTTLGMIFMFLPLWIVSVFFTTRDLAERVLRRYEGYVDGKHQGDRSEEQRNPLVKIVESKKSNGGGGHKKDHAKALSRDLSSVKDLLSSSAVFGAVLAYCYVCEHYPLFSHAEKEPSMLFFCVSFVLFIVVAFATARVCKDDSVLNRDQTEEWKGWMQFLFLTYHFAKAKEAYNLIRVLITAYVWMTGFGNFSFFYIKGDFGLVRMLQMLWRLNFLVVFMVLTTGNDYILYYICPLHTFYFLVVYATMAPLNSINRSQYGPRLKICIAAILIWALFDFSTMSGQEPLFKAIFFWIPTKGASCLRFDGEAPCPVGGYGVSWEWYFRSTLDHWSTVLGMVFALNFPYFVRWIDVLETTSGGRWTKTVVGAVLASVFIFWVKEVLLLEKNEYNDVHAYYGCIPVVVYIFFRNSMPVLRKYHLHLLASMGKITLETYLLQHHIWLTSNAKTLLVFVPGWPMLNLAIVGGLYIYVSRVAYRLTLRLRGILLPSNSLSSCLVNLMGLFCVITMAITMAASAKGAGFDTPLTVFTICIFVAVALLVLIKIVTTSVANPLSAGDTRRTRKEGAIRTRSQIVALVASCAFLVALYGVVTAVRDRVPDVAEASSASSSASSVPSTPEIGSMGHPLLGAVVVVIVICMLVTMDNFAGIGALPTRALLDPTILKAKVTWSAIYGTLHDKLGIKKAGVACTSIDIRP